MHHESSLRPLLSLRPADLPERQDVPAARHDPVHEGTSPAPRRRAAPDDGGLAAAPPPEPVHGWFGDEAHPTPGWWHGVHGTPKVAVVLVDAAGPEQLTCYRAQRSLSGTLAAHGLPVLRFDLRGAGESLDADVEADLCPLWLEDLRAAVATCRDLAEQAPVVLIGTRLGALLAARLAAQADLPLAGVGAILPFTSGRSMLRQALRVELAQGLTVTGDRRIGAVQFGGFRWNAATTTTLAEWRWPETWPAGVPGWVAVDAVRARAQLQRLAACAGDHLLRHPDLHLALNARPLSAWPQPVVDSLLAWLHSLQPAAQQAAPAPGLRRPLPEIVMDGATLAAPVRERIVRLPCVRAIDKGAPLIGTLDTPAHGAHGGRGVLIVGSGRAYRIGPDRLWVDYARQRAALGDTVMRLDLAGVGDSAARLSGDDADALAERDIMTAVSWLRRIRGVEHVAVIGMGSAVWPALQQAVRGAGIAHLVAIDPPALRSPPVRGRRSLSVTGAAPAGPRAWWQHRGRPGLAAAEVRWRLLLKRWGWQRDDDPSSVWLDAVARGVAIDLIHGGPQPSASLRRQIGRTLDVLRLSGCVRVHQMPDADRKFRHPQARASLLALISARLAVLGQETQSAWATTHALDDDGRGPGRESVVSVFMRTQVLERRE